MCPRCNRSCACVWDKWRRLEPAAVLLRSARGWGIDAVWISYTTTPPNCSNNCSRTLPAGERERDQVAGQNDGNLPGDRNESALYKKLCLDYGAHPFKGLEWHNEKKHRHRHRLNPLLLLATSQSRFSASSCERLLKQGVLVRICARRLIAIRFYRAHIVLNLVFCACELQRRFVTATIHR